MSNYAIKFNNGSSNALATGMSDIAVATKLGITLKIKGDRLHNQNSPSADAIAIIAAGHFSLFVTYYGGSLIRLGLESASESGSPLHYTTGVVPSTYDATRWYTIRAYWDTTQTTQQIIEVYDDTGTLVDSTSFNVATAISNGTYGYFELNGGGGFSTFSGGETIEWVAVWNGAPAGTGAPSQPSVGDTGLLRLWTCDDGPGSSTIAESVNNATGALTITGSEGTDFTWIAVSSPADHGTVTLSTSSLLTGASASATVQWYDASNNPIPDPGTVWSVDSDSLGAAIDAVTGAITTSGAGTATIRATTGPVSASADLTMRPTILFTQTVGVS